MADLYNYIFQFPDEGSAERDSVLGPYFGSLVLPQPVEVLVWPNTLINSVTPLPGFWFMITKLGPLDTTLENHPNIQIVNDQTLLAQASQGVVSVIKPNQTAQNPQFPLPLFHTNIVFSNYGPQFTAGLISQLPPPNPVTPPISSGLTDETGATILTDESGTTILEPG